MEGVLSLYIESIQKGYTKESGFQSGGSAFCISGSNTESLHKRERRTENERFTGRTENERFTETPWHVHKMSTRPERGDDFVNLDSAKRLKT